MSKFKQADFSVKQDTKTGGVRVMKVENSTKSSVDSFELRKLNSNGQGDYEATKSKYGALAATDPDRQARNQKDRRFSLSPLLRDPLSVEQEERRAIDERVKVAVQEIAEKARAEAKQEGYQSGLKKGYDEAFSKFQREGEGKTRTLDALLAELESAKTEIFRANERFLMEVVFRVARMIMLKELAADKEYLTRLTRDLVEKVGVRDNIRVRIHPQDAETIAMIRAGLEKSFGAMKNVSIEPSKEVKLGGCIVETEWNMIDATLETQLQGMYDSLVGKT